MPVTGICTHKPTSATKVGISPRLSQSIPDHGCIGQVERWHQTLKNRISQENYFLPSDLEAQIEAFVEHYNHRRYNEGLSNVTPADAYFDRASAIIRQRERIKRQTIERRRLQHRKLAA